MLDVLLLLLLLLLALAVRVVVLSLEVAGVIVRNPCVRAVVLDALLLTCFSFFFSPASRELSVSGSGSPA